MYVYARLCVCACVCACVCVCVVIVVNCCHIRYNCTITCGC